MCIYKLPWDDSLKSFFFIAFEMYILAVHVCYKNRQFIETKGLKSTGYTCHKKAMGSNKYANAIRRKGGELADVI